MTSTKKKIINKQMDAVFNSLYVSITAPQLESDDIDLFYEIEELRERLTIIQKEMQDEHREKR